MGRTTAGLVLVGGLAADGCSQELVIGWLDGTDTAAGTASSGSQGDHEETGTSTLTGTGTAALDGTSASATTSLDSSSEPTTSTGDVPAVECDAPPGHSVCDSDGDPFHAMGLGCGGGKQDTTPVIDPEVVSPDAAAWRVVREYGNPAWSATEGSNVLLLSTGTLPAPDGSGYLAVPTGQTDAVSGDNANPDGVGLPAPVVPELGSMGGAGGRPFVGCDGLGDCSDSLPGPWQAGGPARDLAWIGFDVAVPPGTFGHRLDLVWFSAEYPARAGEPGTDVAVVWQSSEAFTGNVATLDGAALSAGPLAPWLAAQGLVGSHPALSGTGHEGTTGLRCDHPGGTHPDCPRGASTGWLTLTAPAEPGEQLRVVIAVFDLLDTERDTVLLVDHWRWHCPGCEPGVDCGLAPS